MDVILLNNLKWTRSPKTTFAIQVTTLLTKGIVNRKTYGKCCENCRTSLEIPPVHVSFPAHPGKQQSPQERALYKSPMRMAQILELRMLNNFLDFHCSFATKKMCGFQVGFCRTSARFPTKFLQQPTCSKVINSPLGRSALERRTSSAFKSWGRHFPRLFLRQTTSKVVANYG